MNKEKKIKILKALEKSEKGHKGPLNWHIRGMIKNIKKDIRQNTNESFEFEDSRENIEYLTGIKIKKVGCFYF